MFVRSPASVLSVAFALAAVACGATSSVDPNSAASTNSALELTESGDGKTLTVNSTDGQCADARSVVDGHKDELRSLCGDGQIPMPSDVSDSGCSSDQVVSITFKCVNAKRPHAPASGCRTIEVKDDGKAVPSHARQHFSALPPLLCPMIGGAPPPPPYRAPGGPGAGPGAPPFPPGAFPAPVGADGAPSPPMPGGLPMAPPSDGPPQEGHSIDMGGTGPVSGSGPHPVPGGPPPGGPGGPPPGGPGGPPPGGPGAPFPGGPGLGDPAGGACGGPPPAGVECCAPDFNDDGAVPTPADDGSYDTSTK